MNKIVIKNIASKFFICYIVVFIGTPFSSFAQGGNTLLIQNKDENTLLWEVSGKGLSKPSYIFGTFHMLCKEDMQFSDQLKQALTSADQLYLELDMDDPAMLLTGMRVMSMKGNKKLKDLYTATEYAKVAGFFKDSLHLPLILMEGIKPMFLVAMLYPKMLPCKNASGVEEGLMTLAKELKKEVRGLETMELQAAVFDSIPYELQAKELLTSIDSLASAKKDFDKMVNVYKSQQLNDIEALFNKEEFDMKEYQDILLDSRNTNWVKQLSVIMRKQPVFVGVGAGHLVGSKGLVALLKKEGYTLRPLFNR